MDKRTCDWCGTHIGLARADARFCSAKCRVYANRASKQLPVELTSRDRWIRRTADKVPLTVDGKAASSTRAADWSTFASAQKSSAGAGLGFVLNGDGIGCYDIDHCITDGKLSDLAHAFLNTHPGFYTELSPSGTGIHIWVHAEAQKGFNRVIDGLRVEFYTRGRYITVTGKPFTQRKS
jgi:primase-polymerase (primpol)-like protein